MTASASSHLEPSGYSPSDRHRPGRRNVRQLTRLAIAGIAAGGLTMGMTGPALAAATDANLRPDDMVGLQVVDDDDDDFDPLDGDCRWVPDNTRDDTRDNTRDTTRDATTDGIDTRPGLTLTCTNDAPTDDTRGDSTRSDNTRDMTRSIDFTRDLTNTDTNTRGR